MGHWILSHTADTGIEATADSFAGLIEEVMRAMFGLVACLPPGAAERWVEFEVEAATAEDLLVDTLSELLYRSEVDDLVFCDFRVRLDGARLRNLVEAGGVPTPAVQAEGPPIKAVTYHGLVVEERDGGWFARVYFDV
jgi:SHS2 domain-containing protein